MRNTCTVRCVESMLRAIESRGAPLNKAARFIHASRRESPATLIRLARNQPFFRNFSRPAWVLSCPCRPQDRRPLQLVRAARVADLCVVTLVHPSPVLWNRPRSYERVETTPRVLFCLDRGGTYDLEQNRVEERFMTVEPENPRTR